jgi:hypothetical protein
VSRKKTATPKFTREHAKQLVIAFDVETTLAVHELLENNNPELFEAFEALVRFAKAGVKR